MRYALTIDMYIEADNDQLALEKADSVLFQMRDNNIDMNNAAIVDISEAPFASLQTRKLDISYLRSIEDQDYDYDEDGNMLSCCGEVLDPDLMLCPICKEHN
jgi:hypothetical protein